MCICVIKSLEKMGLNYMDITTTINNKDLKPYF